MISAHKRMRFCIYATGSASLPKPMREVFRYFHFEREALAVFAEMKTTPQWEYVELLEIVHQPIENYRRGKDGET